MIYSHIVKPLLFSLDPEHAHDLGSFSLKLLGKCSPACALLKSFTHPNKEPIHAFGLTFPNFVGQAAGLDKDGYFPKASESLGYGFVEIGTVTPKSQTGNDKPRLYRFPENLALVNRMGFNNEGVESLRQRIERSYPKESRCIPLGINLGKGKGTPLNEALQDYCVGFDAIAHIADYITVNVSSPNTPDLRKLQNTEFLTPLLAGINLHRKNWAEVSGQASPPCLLKISPDESFRNIEKIIEKALEHNFDGVIACNTSIGKDIHMHTDQKPEGGVSGKPIEKKANNVIRFISRLTDGTFPIIGSGGIYDYDSAQRKIDSGACLLQIYTSFIYQGPLWPSRLAKRLPLAKSWP